jgi:hypothetical protein
MIILIIAQCHANVNRIQIGKLQADVGTRKLALSFTNFTDFLRATENQILRTGEANFIVEKFPPAGF